MDPTAEQWAAIDDRILACDILGALIRIRAACGVGLNDAKVIHAERYRRLREQQPTDFACTHDDYWRGVYG